jgi:predicted transglutaminase-like cysteine proteinase
VAAVQKVAFMQSYGDTLPPMGYVIFCREHQADCRPKGPFADRIQLTAAKFRELKQVNDQVNTTVIPMTDLQLYGKVDWWAYPDQNKGDCEDYVLQKRRLPSRKRASAVPSPSRKRRANCQKVTESSEIARTTV